MTLSPAAVAFIIVFAVVVCLTLAFQFSIAIPWFKAFMSGAPVSVLDVLAMRLRRINVASVVAAMVAAKQGGISVSCAEAQQASLQGVDLRKITLAAIEAKKRGLNMSFSELVDAELQGQLAEKLKA